MNFYLYQFFIVFFATLGFAIYFNSPKKTIFSTCVLSSLIWIFFKVFYLNFNDYSISAFFASFLLGLCGEFLARKLKTPATVFIIPSLFPMVPGANIYYTMYYFIFKDYEKSLSNAADTLTIALYLAIGIVFSLATSKMILAIKNKEG